MKDKFNYIATLTLIFISGFIIGFNGLFIEPNYQLENELDLVIYKSGYQDGVINVLENGNYKEFQFKSDSIWFRNKFVE